MDYEFFANRVHFWGSSRESKFCERLNKAIESRLFQIKETLTIFLNRGFKEILFINTSNFNATNAKESFEILAKKFNFSICDNEIFATQFYNNIFGHFLPIVYRINQECKIALQTSGSSDCIEVLGLNIPNEFKGIKFICDSKTLEKLQDKEILQKTREKLQNFIDQAYCFVSQVRVDCKFILDKLKNDKESRIKLQAILKEEFSIVKQIRPDIVQSWKYYQEFEKMCEEMDKEL